MEKRQQSQGDGHHQYTPERIYPSQQQGHYPSQQQGQYQSQQPVQYYNHAQLQYSRASPVHHMNSTHHQYADHRQYHNYSNYQNHARRDSDTFSLNSNQTTGTTSGQFSQMVNSMASSPASPGTPAIRSISGIDLNNLEEYRARVKQSNDSEVQFEFCKHLVFLAQELQKNPSILDEKAAKKNIVILHQEAIKWAKKAARNPLLGKNGLSEALFFLADCYGNGTLGCKIDHDRAFGYYSQASKQGHAPSMYRTGVCYEVGAGPKKNAERAVHFYKKASSAGDTSAMFKLGMILLKGTLGQKKDALEGVNYLKKAATQADEATAYALHELAILYEGINLDPETNIFPDSNHSFELFLKSANLGYAPSQYKLGLAYEFGHLNLPCDPKRSIAWYTKAARQAFPEAELALSGWYLTGCEFVLEKNEIQAFLWAKKASDKGLAKADYALGYFLEHGVGCRQDMEEARRFYLSAAGQGEPRAMNRLSNNPKNNANISEWRKESEAKDGKCSLM